MFNLEFDNQWMYVDNFYLWQYKNMRIVVSTKFYATLDEVIDKLGIKNFAYMKQIHSSEVFEVNSGGEYKCDGIYTDKRNLALVVKTADCVPIFFFNKTYIGIVHAGWRGTVKKIASKIENFKDVSYLIGPAIRDCCYEVGEDVIDELKKVSSGLSFYKKGNKYRLDLIDENRYILKGCKELNSLPLCTSCNSHIFYSYRKNKDKSRNYGIIMKI